MSNPIKIRPVGIVVSHVDGQTDMTKLIVAFRNFAKAPIIIIIIMCNYKSVTAKGAFA